MDIAEQYKEASGAIGQIILRIQKRTIVLHSLLFSLEKVLYADSIGVQQNEGACEVVKVHMQNAENLIYAHSDYFSVRWLKLFAQIKTQWDKEILDGTWGEYIKTAEYKSNIDDLRFFSKYIPKEIFQFSMKVKIGFLISIIFLILIECIIFGKIIF
jgi:hypothetical protein